MTVGDLVLNLKAAGFDKKLIENYLSCWQKGSVKDQLEILSAKRDDILDSIHKEEKQICYLDYLVYCIEKEKNEM